MSKTSELELREERSDVSPGKELLAAFLAELVEMYGSFDPSRTPSAKAEEMAPPGGTFLVLYDRGRAVACGGLKRLAADMGEIKRMYVVPEARGKGHGRRILVGLEEAARRLGYPRVRLDTGEKQPHAQSLYATSGYRAIPDYNNNHYAARWYEKDL